MNKSFYAHTLLLLTLFAGCQKHRKKQELVVQNKQEDIYQLQEAIARLVDIPDVPLQCNVVAVVESEEGSGEVQLICDCSQAASSSDIICYYKEEMERIGWQLHSEYDKKGEALLVFIKPRGSVCVISIRDGQKIVITNMRSKA